MLANATAEATGRVLASRLYNMTDDSGMKDMLSFLIARDTMHQQQWLAVIEELGGLSAVLPIPNSTPAEHEATEHSYYFLNTSIDEPTPTGRWSSGPSLDGRSQFTVVEGVSHGMGQKPDLGKAREHSGAQLEQVR
jgi:Mn-containing catalase